MRRRSSGPTRAGAILIGKTTTSEFGCKARRRQPAHRHHAQSLEPRQDAGRIERRRGGVGRRRHHAVRARHRRRRLDPYSRRPDRACPASRASFGRIPVWPVSATPTLAHVGPMARTVEDAALLFMACAGYDARDPHSVAGPVPDLVAACEQDVRGLRIAYSPTLGYARCDAEVLRVVGEAAKRFEAFGCTRSIWSSACSSAIRSISGRPSSTPASARGCARSSRPNRDLLDPAVADILDRALAPGHARLLRQGVRALRAARQIASAVRALRHPAVAGAAGHVASTSAATCRPICPTAIWCRGSYYTYPFNLTGQPAATVCAADCRGRHAGGPADRRTAARRSRCDPCSGCIPAQQAGGI